jgi:hypothetical protein
MPRGRYHVARNGIRHQFRRSKLARLVRETESCFAPVESLKL